MEPSEPPPPEPGAAPTPDDWTPWATPEAPESAPGAESPAEAGASAPAPPVAAPAAPTSRRRVAPTPVVVASSATTPVSIGGIVVAVGAAIAVAGTFLNMVKVTVGVNSLRAVTLNSTTTYFDTNRGKLVAAIAAAVLVVALVGLLRGATTSCPPPWPASGASRYWAFSIYDRIDVDTFIDDQRASLKGNTLRSLFEANVGPALYVCMGGGVLILIGALMAARRK
jgi:hypothetical protein